MIYRTTRRTLIDAEFNSLFGRYEQPLCSYLARLTGSVPRAQELTQEVFLRAYDALLRGEQWNDPQAWLYRVASRLATDDYRRQRLFRWLPLSGREPNPGEGVETATVERSAVQSALEALPPRYRIPLVLYSCAGYSVAEVAEMIGVSAGAVGMRLSRAREMFRQAYQLEEKQ